MTPRGALPERYLVDREGTPDPDASRYYVLDVVHDMDARFVLRMLVRSYRSKGPSTRADELEKLLNDSQPAFAEFVRARTARLQGPGGKNNHPKRVRRTR